MVRACFSTSLLGSVNGRRASCGGRPAARKHHRDWPRQLLCGHARSFGQERSAEVDKAGKAKKMEAKQHKQVVSAASYV